MRLRLRAEKAAKALVSRVAYQGLKAQTYGPGVRCGTASSPRLFEKLVIDVEGLLHTYDSAIIVWL